MTTFKALSHVSVADALERLKVGTTLLKYGRSGNPHFRYFYLSPDLTRLQWKKDNRKKSFVKLDDVKELRIGQKTAVFERHRNYDIEDVSFSLILGSRTLDVSCKDRAEFDVWVVGLLSLTSGNQQKEPLTKGKTISNFGRLSEHQVEAQRARGSSEGTASINSPGGQGRKHSSGRSLQGALEKLRSAAGETGDVYTWGGNKYGKLGQYDGDDIVEEDTFQDQANPQLLEQLLDRDVRLVACGSNHTAVLIATGHLYTWGSGSDGKLGHGGELDYYTPRRVEALIQLGVQLVQVACGDNHTLALSDDGVVYSWGCGETGQLGLGGDLSQWTPTLVYSLMGKNVRQIACGPWHSAAVCDTGDMYTWGGGEFGQLGLGTTEAEFRPQLVEELKGKGVWVTCGAWHTVAIAESGDIYAWGDGSYGQLGQGDKTQHSKPQRVDTGGHVIRQVACGWFHTAALTVTGTVLTWGKGEDGQLGHGGDVTVKSPRAVSELENHVVCQLASGANHSAALTDAGEVYSWGLGANGRLGHGDVRDQRAPKRIDALVGKDVRQVVCGSDLTAVTCAHHSIEEKHVNACMRCKLAFTLTRRKGKCRNCGGIFCPACSQNKYPLLKFGFDAPVKVCDGCYAKLTQGESDKETKMSGVSSRRRTGDHEALSAMATDRSDRSTIDKQNSSRNLPGRKSSHHIISIADQTTTAPWAERELHSAEGDLLSIVKIGADVIGNREMRDKLISATLKMGLDNFSKDDEIFATVEDETAAIDRCLVALSSQVESRQQTKDSATHESKELEGIIELLTAQISERDKAVEAVKEEKDKLQRLNSILTNQLLKKESTVEEASKDALQLAQDLLQKVEDNQKQLQELRTQVSSGDSSDEVRRRRASTLATEHSDAAQREVESLRSLYQAKDEMKMTATQEIEQLKPLLAELEEMLSRKECQKQQLEAEHKEMCSAVDKLTEQRNQRASLRSNAEDEADELRSVVEEMECQGASLMNVKERLASAQEVLRTRLEDWIPFLENDPARRELCSEDIQRAKLLLNMGFNVEEGIENDPGDQESRRAAEEEAKRLSMELEAAVEQRTKADEHTRRVIAEIQRLKSGSGLRLALPSVDGSRNTPRELDGVQTFRSASATPRLMNQQLYARGSQTHRGFSVKM